jgi:hypothetical protein
MAANNIPQPRTVNYNQVRVLWTDEECLYLLNQRMTRNDEYWVDIFIFLIDLFNKLKNDNNFLLFILIEY